MPLSNFRKEKRLEMLRFLGVYEDGTQYWVRTSDPIRVKDVLYH